MLKTFLIGLKDLRLAFRDRAALLLMLLAPFLLTVGMGFVTGRFSGQSSGIRDIPVILVLLSGVDAVPAELVFLRQLHAVRLAEPDDTRALAQLQWASPASACQHDRRPLLAKCSSQRC